MIRKVARKIEMQILVACTKMQVIYNSVTQKLTTTYLLKNNSKIKIVKH